MKIDILGVGISNLTHNQVIEEVDRLILDGRARRSHFLVKPNPEFIMLAQKDNEYKHILNQASLAPADGFGLIWASRMLKNPLKGRSPGVEQMLAICKLCEEKGYSVYLLGSEGDVILKTVEKLEKLFPNLSIKGYHHGYFNSEEEQEIIEEIRMKRPDVLFVALGFGKQEKWIFHHLDQLRVPLSIGEGGSFDFISGKIKRAPDFMRKSGFEWLYRLVKQPWRIGRQLKLPYFVLLVLIARVKS